MLSLKLALLCLSQQWQLACAPLQLDLHIDTTGQLQKHQPVYGLRSEVFDIHQPRVYADLELFSCVLVHVWRSEHSEDLLPAPRKATELHKAIVFSTLSLLCGDQIATDV